MDQEVLLSDGTDFEDPYFFNFNFHSEHQTPYSLATAIKRKGKQGLKSQGDVVEVMDKTIGRLVYRVKGAVSANNFLIMDNLHLAGPWFYLSYSLTKPAIATIHLEITTSNNLSFRVTFSTLYDKEKPKFLGRSLR
jgi:hypothetical protein